MTNQDEAAKLAAIERRAGWQTIMSTPAARRVIWEQFEAWGIYQISPSVEPAALAFNEGKRSLALQIMHDMLMDCPDQYDRMVIENRARLRLQKTEAESENKDQ